MTNHDNPAAPMLLEPRFHTRIWGGRRLEQELGYQLPTADAYGEAWCMGNDNRILTGPHQGATLEQAVASDPANMLGALVLASGRSDLPLLYKILDCQDWLSIQVHPNDQEAQELENEPYGKTEAWYIIAAEPGARIIHGFAEPMSREALIKSVEDNTIANHLRYLELQTGDPVFTPAGLIHALGGGLLLGEIQEQSDITYRLYDWDRRDPTGNPRQLHVEKSAAVTHYQPPDFGKNQPLKIDMGDSSISHLIACRYFAYQLLYVSGVLGLDTRGTSFHGLYCVDGATTLYWGKSGRLDVSKGQTVFIPAATGYYALSGTGAHLLRWFVPDLQADVITPLLDANFDQPAILQLAGGEKSNDLADPTLWPEE